MITNFLPTSTEATQTATWITYVLATSGSLLAACLFFRWLLDLIDNVRAVRAEARENERHARLREIEAEKYYRRALDAAAVAGSPWPPARIKP